MADKSIFSVEVDGFDKFKSSFDEYAATLKTTVDDWKAISKAIKDAQGSVKGLHEAIRGLRAANDNARNARPNAPPKQPPPTSDPKFQTAIQGMNRHLGTVADEIKGIGKTLLRQAGSYGGAGSASAVTGVESVISSFGRSNMVAMVASMAAAAVTAPMLAAFAAAPDVANLRKQGLQLGGLNTGTMRAARAAGSWMDDPTQGLRATVAARRDVSGPQFQAYAQMFGMRGAQAEMGKAPGMAQFDYLDKAVEKLNALPENLQDTMAEQMGMTNVFSLNTIRAWQSMTEKDRQERRQRWADVSTQTAMSPQDSKKWFDFYDKLKASGEIMEAGIIKKLQPLIGPLGAWVDKFASMVNQDGGVISDWVAEMGKVLDENPPEKVIAKIQAALAGFPSFDDIKKDLAMLVDAINGFANNPIVKWFASQAIKHPVATAVGAAVVGGAVKTGAAGAVAGTVGKEVVKGVAKAPVPALLGGVAAGSMIIGEGSGNKRVQEIIKSQNPDLSDEDMKKWAAEQEAALKAAQEAKKHPTADERKRKEQSDRVLKSVTPKTPATKGGWSWRHPFRKTAAEGDEDFHQYIQNASDLRSLGPSVGGALQENPAASAVGGTGTAMTIMRYLPLLRSFFGGAGGAALGGVGAAGAVMWPKPAETGELPEKYWPQNQANMPTGEGQNVAFETGNVGGGFKLPGQADPVELAEQRKQTELLSGIKDHMDKAEAFGTGGTLAGGLTGGGGGGGIGPGQPRTTGPGGADLSGTGETGGATGVSGGGGVRGILRRLGVGGAIPGGAPTGIARRGTGGGGGGGFKGGGGSSGGGGASGSVGGAGGGDDSGVAVGGAAKGSVAAAIFAGESRGDYNIYNQNPQKGRLRVGHMDFSKMTVGEVMQAQREGKVFAAGAYQVIPKTLQGAVSSLKIDPNTKFDKATQDKIFSGYLATKKKGRGALEDYIKGKSDNSDAALKAAAQEWASIQYHGRGIYDKDGVNHGGISDARMLTAMKNAREAYAKTGNYQGALFGQTDTKAAVAQATPRQSGPGRSPTGPQAQQTAAATRPDGIKQWQMEPRPKIEMHNKTGADMHLSASTMAV